jgi:hypothetical protein
LIIHANSAGLRAVPACGNRIDLSHCHYDAGFGGMMQPLQLGRAQGGPRPFLIIL